MDLNPDLLNARFTEIRQSIERLEAMRELTLEEFLQDQDTLDIAAYRLLVAIEAALQVCFHVSARGLHQAPEAYADCFSILNEHALIPTDLAHNLQQMARFRNMLEHVYWKIDYQQVYTIIRDHLDDLRAFVRAIGELL